MEILNRGILYENPLPHLRSIQSMFSGLCRLPDGTLLASMQLGEAFEAVNCTSYTAKSTDNGVTWSMPEPMFDKSCEEYPLSDSCKITWTGDRVTAFGMQYHRRDMALPIGNAQTGGVLESDVFYSESFDNGRTWSERRTIPMDWGMHTEATAPITVAADGSYVSPVTVFPAWDGSLSHPLCGKLLVSRDAGKTWDQSATCMQFDQPDVTCYEQRACRLDSGDLINIGWNENIRSEQRPHNHYTVSNDNGRTFSEPRDTGVQGQASSVMALPNERLLALHAIRRDTDRPGIYGFVIDFSHKNWDVAERFLLWEPQQQLRPHKGLADIFAYVRFGQPSAIQLSDNELLMTHWACEEGQYKTFTTRIRL